MWLYRPLQEGLGQRVRHYHNQFQRRERRNERNDLFAEPEQPEPRTGGSIRAAKSRSNQRRPIMAGLVTRQPVYQADGNSNPLKGNITKSGKGKLVQKEPAFQADSNKDLTIPLRMNTVPKSKKLPMKDVQKTKQKAGLTNQGYGI
jgi:hypothetical protein